MKLSYEPSLKDQLEILQRTHDLFLNPTVWIQGVYAQDLNGNPVSSQSPEACRFCLVGGLNNSSHKIHPKYNFNAIQVRQRIEQTAGLGKYISAGSLEGWNDHEERTHTEVLELLFSTMVNIKDEMESNNASRTQS